MKKIGWVLSFSIILFPIFVSADCADLGRFTNWILETSHAVVFYAGEKPLARVEIPYCEITRLSTIRLLKSMVDGVACRIITV